MRALLTSFLVASTVFLIGVYEYTLLKTEEKDAVQLIASDYNDDIRSVLRERLTSFHDALERLSDQNEEVFETRAENILNDYSQTIALLLYDKTFKLKKSVLAFPWTLNQIEGRLFLKPEDLLSHFELGKDEILNFGVKEGKLEKVLFGLFNLSAFFEVYFGGSEESLQPVILKLNGNVIYSKNTQDIAFKETFFSQQEVVILGGHWDVLVWPAEETVKNTLSYHPLTSLTVFTLLSLFTGSLVYFLIRAHTSLKELRVSNRSKEFFIQVLNDDLKVRLESLNENLKEVRKGSLDNKGQTYLQKSHRSLQVVQKMMGGMQFLSQFEKPEFRLNKEMKSMQTLILDTLKMYSQLAKEKGIHIDFTSPHSFPDEVLIDPQLMRYVIAEFVSFAIGHTVEGKVSVTLTRECQEGSSDIMILSVVDTGLEVSQDEIRAYFQPFSFEAIEEVGVFGKGVGLSIAYSMALMMGGRVIVESHHGKGNLFKLSFPIVFKIFSRF